MNNFQVFLQTTTGPRRVAGYDLLKDAIKRAKHYKRAYVTGVPETIFRVEDGVFTGPFVWETEEDNDSIILGEIVNRRIVREYERECERELERERKLAAAIPYTTRLKTLVTNYMSVLRDIAAAMIAVGHGMDATDIKQYLELNIRIVIPVPLLGDLLRAARKVGQYFDKSTLDHKSVWVLTPKGVAELSTPPATVIE